MPKKTKRRKPESELLWVEVLEAKPNKMFTEELRQAVRFLRYSRAVACAECGKKQRILWTMICSFRAMNTRTFVMAPGPVRMPLTPICQDHPLAPAVEQAPVAASHRHLVIGPRPNQPEATTTC